VIGKEINMDKNTNQQQQGDVNIERCESIPPGVIKRDHLVLSHGEAGKHKHQIVCDEGQAEIIEKEKGELYVSVINGAVILYHGNDEQIQKQLDEPGNFDYEKEDVHKPQKLQPGMYRISLVREYDYEAREPRHNMD